MTTLFVATDGGHITELVAIADRLPADVVDGAVWASNDTPQSRSMLEGRHAVFVPAVGVKDIKGVLRSLPVAHRLHREHKFTRVISTGSGIALAYLPYLALRGARAHYIESATRLTEPSVTGKVLARIPGMRMYTQYEAQAHGPWHYAGWVYDRFTVTKTEPGPIKRAVVVLGSSKNYPFRRLLDALVPLLGAGGALEQAQGSPVETLWQTGGTPADGLGIDAHPFVPSAELDAAIAQADVVIGHAGAGTSLSALTSGRCPVLIARDPARGELMDEHQVLFARLLDERGVAMHREPETLSVEDLIEAASSRVESTTTPIPFRLVP